MGEVGAALGSSVLDALHEWVWRASEEWELDMNSRMYQLDAEQDRYLVDVDQHVYELLQRRMTRQRLQVRA